MKSNITKEKVQSTNKTKMIIVWNEQQEKHLQDSSSRLDLSY